MIPCKIKFLLFVIITYLQFFTRYFVNYLIIYEMLI